MSTQLKNISFGKIMIETGRDMFSPVKAFVDALRADITTSGVATRGGKPAQNVKVGSYIKAKAKRNRSASRNATGNKSAATSLHSKKV